MEAIFAAAKESLLRSASAGRNSTRVHREEARKLVRYLQKVALVLGELELQVAADEALRGSRALFMGVEAACGAVQQAEGLLEQVGDTGKARVWPLEEAVEFQSVALELLSAMSGLAALDINLPDDVRADARHFARQLQQLQFTASELEASGEAELAEVQREQGHPRIDSQHPAASAGGEAPLTPGPVAPHEQTFASTLEGPQQPLPVSEPDKAAGEGGDIEAEIQQDMDQVKRELEEAAKVEEAGGSGTAQTAPHMGAPSPIPQPDESIMQELDRQGVVFVSLDDSTTTALPPGCPVKGTGQRAQQRLPTDPFMMMCEHCNDTSTWD